jgi:hypothetical protein
MRLAVVGILLTNIFLLQGAFSQDALLSRLPSCAVSLQTLQKRSVTPNNDPDQARCFEATVSSSSCSSNNISCLCSDVAFRTTAATCNAANCTVIASLSAINETNAACGIPVRDESGTMIGVTASVGALALLMVIMRLVDRSCSAQTRLGWDDLLIAISGVCSTISLHLLESCVY